MKRISKDTKTFQVFTALCEGQALTEAQARKQFKVGNLRAEVTRIRQHGYAVYRKNRVAGNGVKVTEYVIGKPSRRIVAAGYRAIQLGLA